MIILKLLSKVRKHESILHQISRAYSYYIEVSVDGKDFIKIIDYSNYHCRSWQNLYFPQRVVRFIRVVGTHNTVRFDINERNRNLFTHSGEQCVSPCYG